MAKKKEVKKEKRRKPKPEISRLKRWFRRRKWDELSVRFFLTIWIILWYAAPWAKSWKWSLFLNGLFSIILFFFISLVLTKRKEPGE